MLRLSLRCVQPRSSRPASLAFLAASAFTPSLSFVSASAKRSSVCAASPATSACHTPVMTVSTVPTGPTWTLEYDALTSQTLQDDLAEAASLLDVLEKRASDDIRPHVHVASTFQDVTSLPVGLIDALVACTKDYWGAVVLLRNVATQASCVASVDGLDATAKKLSADMSVKFSKLQNAYQPAQLFLDLCTDDVLQTFLDADDEMKTAEFSLRHSRKLRQHRLSLPEENVINTLAVTGHSSWGTLYTDLSSTLKVTLTDPDKGGSYVTGIATADALRDSPDESVRREAWHAVRDAWLPHQETCVAILNAITGWRLDMYEKRGYGSFLTSTLHMNRMSEATLTALLSAVEESTETGRSVLKIQAEMLGKERLQPWDLFAPAPVKTGVGRLYSFEEGIELIADAVGEVDEEAGAFVRMMRDNGWIEASRGDTKRPGAYCTGFAKSRTPRVYLSDYNGRAALLLTLAHELGHAFHSWQMRDLPQAQLSYPMNLAETASIFFETVVGNKLLDGATCAEERVSILWGEAMEAATFLLNIPARYRFEEELNERRKSGKLSVEEVDEMMVGAWTRYYGEALGDKDKVGVFSQSKLHFYLTGISFYNWPYTFGYLFALGVYAEYESGKHVSFATLYRELLRDTGRMSAEDVVMRHLGGDIEDAAFWKRAIGVAEGKVKHLGQVAEQLGMVNKSS